MNSLKLNLIHIYILVPLLIYIYFQKEKTEEKCFGFLAGIIIMIPFLIEWDLIKKYDFNNTKYILPYFYYIPLFLYISYKGQNTHNYAFKILPAVAIIQVILNIYFILERLNYFKNNWLILF